MTADELTQLLADAARRAGVDLSNKQLDALGRFLLIGLHPDVQYEVAGDLADVVQPADGSAWRVIGEPKTTGTVVSSTAYRVRFHFDGEPDDVSETSISYFYRHWEAVPKTGGSKKRSTSKK